MPWFRDVDQHDPKPNLAEVNIPVLAGFREKALFVPAAQNGGSLRTALNQSASDTFMVQSVKNVYHWMQPVKTGLPGEIEQIKTQLNRCF